MGESTIGLPVRDEPPQGGLRSLVRRVGQVDEIGVIGALIVLIVLLAVLVPDTFLTAQNFINVSRQASYVGIMAVGMVFVIAMGDIDLSVGSIWMLSSVMMAIALRDGYSIWIAVAVCMLVATLCGLLNGALERRARHPDDHRDPGHAQPLPRPGIGRDQRDAGLGLQPRYLVFRVDRRPRSRLRHLDQRLGHAHRRHRGLDPVQPARPSAGACRRSAATARPRSSPVSGSRARGSWS